MNLDMAQVLEDIAKDPRCVGYDGALNGMAKMWRKMESENRDLRQQLLDAKADFRRIRSMVQELRDGLSASVKKETDT